MDNLDNQLKGKNAENMALYFLKNQGFDLLEKNYLCYFGEIDLVMQDKDQIVFVEVRSRSRNDFGTALESINAEKIRKLNRAATHFLQKKNWFYTRSSRFDIVAIDLSHNIPQIDWIKSAFCVN
jgi:putative endonuclease